MADQGHDRLEPPQAEHVGTYAHATLVDRDELDYPDLLDSASVTIVSPARG